MIETVQYKLEKFEESKNIIDWLTYFTAYVWEEMKFSYEEDKSLSKVDEREITNKLVRDIAKLIKKDRIPLPVRLFHTPSEAANGSDIEIIVQLKENENIIFPCQCKRLYVEDSKKDDFYAVYKKFGHNSQTDKIIEYSKKIKGFPMYLFYNYTSKEVPINYTYPNRELYGCTLASAIFLKDNPLDVYNFKNLHPPAVPITSIFKFKSILSLNTIWGNVSDHYARVLSNKDIFEDGKWEEIGPPIYHKKRFVPHLDFERILNRVNVENLEIFNPKFRIMFTANPIDLNCRKNNFNI